MKPFRSALPPAGLASLLAGLLWQQQVSLELAQLDREACAMCLHLMAQPPASVQHEVALAELEGLLSARAGLPACRYSYCGSRLR